MNGMPTTCCSHIGQLLIVAGNATWLAHNKWKHWLSLLTKLLWELLLKNWTAGFQNIPFHNSWCFPFQHLPRCNAYPFLWWSFWTCNGKCLEALVLPQQLHGQEKFEGQSVCDLEQNAAPLHTFGCWKQIAPLEGNHVHQHWQASPGETVFESESRWVQKPSACVCTPGSGFSHWWWHFQCYFGTMWIYGRIHWFDGQQQQAPYWCTMCQSRGNNEQLHGPVQISAAPQAYRLHVAHSDQVSHSQAPCSQLQTW